MKGNNNEADSKYVKALDIIRSIDVDLPTVIADIFIAQAESAISLGQLEAAFALGNQYNSTIARMRVTIYPHYS
jgi:hypothetical protein